MPFLLFATTPTISFFYSSPFFIIHLPYLSFQLFNHQHSFYPLLHPNTMTDNRLNVFCLVDGEATSNAFSVKVLSTDTVDDLKKLIKTEKSPEFDGIAADKLTLWKVSIPDDDNDDEVPILLGNVSDKDKRRLKATTKLLKVFDTELLDDTIHVIVQRPRPCNADELYFH